MAGFAASLPAGARVLDAGAGEVRHAPYFTRQRYCGVDLAVGDRTWNYSRLDARSGSRAPALRRRLLSAPPSTS